MSIQGFPLSAKLPDEPGFGDRFWYWQGQSGRNYIHSIYHAGSCPPLPGAVYVAVRHEPDGRKAVATGRFPSYLDQSLKDLATRILSSHGADEIHVHLLARDDQRASEVLSDLRAVDEPAARRRLSLVQNQFHIAA